MNHLLNSKCRTLGLLLLMCCTAVEAGQPTLVYLVRHAEKQVDQGDDPVLSTLGEARVAKLQHFFKDISLDGVYATPYRRTKMTVSAMADSRNLEVKILPPKDYRGWKKEIKRQRGKTLLIAGHSNTIPEIIKTFGVEVPTIDESQYDYLFLLVVHGRKARLQVFQFKL